MDDKQGGWCGRTGLTLDNGQAMDPARTRRPPVGGHWVDQNVKITPTLSGSRLMDVEKCGSRVRVERMK